MVKWIHLAGPLGLYMKAFCQAAKFAWSNQEAGPSLKIIFYANQWEKNTLKILLNRDFLHPEHHRMNNGIKIKPLLHWCFPIRGDIALPTGCAISLFIFIPSTVDLYRLVDFRVISHSCLTKNISGHSGKWALSYSEINLYLKIVKIKITKENWYSLSREKSWKYELILHSTASGRSYYLWSKNHDTIGWHEAFYAL